MKSTVWKEEEEEEEEEMMMKEDIWKIIKGREEEKR